MLFFSNIMMLTGSKMDNMYFNMINIIFSFTRNKASAKLSAIPINSNTKITTYHTKKHIHKYRKRNNGKY